MSKNFNEELPNMMVRLKNIQKELNLSNKEMATTIGVSEKHYKYRILNGLQAISMDQLFMLYDKYNISIDHLFSGESHPDTCPCAEQPLCIEKLTNIESNVIELNKNFQKSLDKGGNK